MDLVPIDTALGSIPVGTIPISASNVAACRLECYANMNPERGARVTIADVAAAANVSRSTASRAVSGHPAVSSAARRAVLEAASALGYRVNPAARALRGGSSRLIGLVVTNLVNASIQTVVETLHDRSHRAGYQVLMAVTGGDQQREAEVLEALVDHRVAGLFIMPSGSSPDRLNALVASGLPVVSLIRDLRGLEVPVVLDDDRAGAAAATNHLLGLGHRDIAFVGGPPSVHSGRERFHGYRDALRAAGMNLQQTLVHRGPFEPAWGAEVARRITTGPPACSSAVVANHEALHGMVRTLAQSGVDLPARLSLIGFEDAPLFSYWHPAISVVDTHPAELAVAAFDMLMEQVNGGRRSRDRPRLVVESALLIRESTGRPPLAQ